VEPLQDSESVDVLGIPVSCRSLEATVELIGEWIDSGAREYVCVTGTHGVIQSQKDPTLADIHVKAGLVVPDGMPMVWSGHWAGARGMRRIRGADLMVRVLQEAEKQGWSSFLYGGKPGTPERLERKLKELFPALTICGTYSPPFRSLNSEEIEEIELMINAAKPSIVWVGLSTPKQEHWMHERRHQIDAPVMFGVGAAFDMLNGDLRQAPVWIQESGFEWLFRLSQEPRRLWRRYARVVPTFMVSILRNPPKLAPPAPRPEG
jgi:N-acetylglucosaminyldiphosphoundecaprenol N-acetyl-beta-D-mannosaminyltransferase